MAGASTGDFTFKFKPEVDVEAAEKVVITFPDGFDASGASLKDSSGFSGAEPTIDPSASDSNTITLANGSVSSDPITLVFAGVQNPAKVGPISNPFLIGTQDENSQTLMKQEVDAGITITAPGTRSRDTILYEKRKK